MWRCTQYKSREEKVDPPHDDSLRDKHDHIPLHHIHHLIHPARISKRIWGCLSPHSRFLEVLALLECSLQETFTGVKYRAGDMVCVLPEELRAAESASIVSWSQEEGTVRGWI